MKHLIVGTAGHIDHGKSALVLALTGTDPDRWEEEKRRGITIDLGFAHLDLDDGLRVGFVDVPGHERFVRNMLAGVGGIDLVLLVVAADESIKPQTREHFDICRLIGVKRGLVAITKADLVDRELLDLVRLEVQEFVAGSFLEGAPILAVSARTGEGLAALKDELRRLGREVAPKPEALPFRLPVDRAFVMKGFGAVVTGTLITGKIGKEAEVEIYPLGRRARIRGIEIHNEAVEIAIAGQRTALNLAGVEARDISRGMTLATPGWFQATAQLDATVSLLSRAPALKHRARVHFHCGTAETIAEVVWLDGKTLAPGGEACARLRLADAGLYLPGDRFIMRQFSPVTTIGGGTILDNHPPRHRLRDRSVSEFLSAMAQADSEKSLELLVEQAGEATQSAMVARTGSTPDEVLRLAKQIETRKRVHILPQSDALLVSAAHFEDLSRRLLGELDSFHRANPLLPGLPKEDLRARAGVGKGMKARLPSIALLNAALQSLAAAGKIEMEGELARLRGQEVQLTGEEQAARAQISDAFRKAGLAVPTTKDVLASLRLDRARAEKILHLLLREKALVKLTEDLILHPSALQHLRALVAERKKKSSQIDVAVFKEMTGLTRKYAIPLLEYLDRERLTRRQGDTRIIL